MSQRASSGYILPIIMFVIALTIAAVSPASAQSTCAVEVNNGVLCDGPRSVQASYLPLIQSGGSLDGDRNCPQPVGNGVICTGPEIPDPQSSPAARSVPTSGGTARVYLPLLGG